MLTCEKCNTQFDEGASFCPECGTKATEMVFCQSCGEKTSNDFKFCQKCGKSLNDDVTKPVTQKSSVTKVNFITTVMKKIKPLFNKLPKKTIAIILAVLIIISVVVVINPFDSRQKLWVTYIKDSEINLTFLNNIKPFEVTSKLSDKTIDSNSSYGFFSTVKYSADGRYMFYPDKLISSSSSGSSSSGSSSSGSSSSGSSSSSMSLYYRDLKADNTKSDAAIKIDSEINSNYKISNNGTKVFYIKGSENNLYFHNLKDKEKIDSGVSEFYINEDGSVIVYTKEGILYKKEIGSQKEKIKIDSDVTINAISSDLKKIYYTKEKSLYLKEDIKDKQKISSEVDNLVARYDDGSLYYIKGLKSEVSLSDYVTDDLKESDALITVPNTADYQTIDSGYGYYSIDYEAYNEAYNKYNAKTTRDTLRQSLITEKIELNNKTLYYYDGSKETLISDSLNSTIALSSKKPMVVYTKYNKSEVSKVKISEIKAISEVRSLVTAAQSSSSETYIAINAKETVIDQTKASLFKFNYSSNKLYFIDDYSQENSYGTLMELNITADTISKPTTVDEDVNSFIFKTDSDSIIYFKDVKNYSGDMYENKKSIATDVSPVSVISLKGSSALIYFTDVSMSSGDSSSSEDSVGTLNILNGAKATKIADDVQMCVAFDEKNIAYISNYSANTKKGDAFLFSGSSKPVIIDTDILGEIYPNSGSAIMSIPKYGSFTYDYVQNHYENGIQY